MTIHVVELVASRFCKVFVEDEDESMTNEQIVEKAKKQFLEDDDPDSYLDDEMNDIAPQDIISASYQYDIYD